MGYAFGLAREERTLGMCKTLAAVLQAARPLRKGVLARKFHGVLVGADNCVRARKSSFS